jgi:nucleoside-diphosphate-sugar epimerase
MQVLLAGASGAIGSHLVPQLMAAGHKVTGLSRRPERLAETGAKAIGVDLLDRGAVLDAVRGQHFDAVVHQATDLRRAPTTYSSMLTTNRLRSEGTSTLIAVAKATGAKKFVTASIFYGYGFDDFGNKPVLETETFARATSDSLDAVRFALASNEQQVRAFGGVSLRYGLFYGDGVVAPVASADWSGLLPVVHLADAASAVVRALERGRPGHVYNIADANPVSWRELQQAAATAAGERMPLLVPSWVLRASAPFAAQLLTSTSMRLSTTKARRELGWAPQYANYAEGLRELVALG